MGCNDGRIIARKRFAPMFAALQRKSKVVRNGMQVVGA